MCFLSMFLTYRIKDILFGDAFIMLLCILFYNQISLAFIDKIRSQKTRIRRININHAVAIFASFFYTLIIYKRWNGHEKDLNLYENYLIIIFIIVLLSGVFSFIIYAIFNKDAFIINKDFAAIYIRKELDRTEQSKKTSTHRIQALAFETSNDWKGEVQELMYDGQPFSAYPSTLKDLFNFKYEKQDQYSIVSYRWLMMPSGSILAIIKDTIIKTRGTSEHHFAYIISKDCACLVFDDSENPKNTAFYKFIKHLRNTSIKSETLKGLLDELLSFEKKLLEEYITHPHSNNLLPLGAIWYYVLMVVVGTKIDYIIPVSRLAKFCVFLLTLYRLIVLGTFLSIIMKKYT
jgi:hypothetical protein